MSAAQIIMAIWIAGSLAVHVFKHGQARPDTFNGWRAATIMILLSVLLWWGGFWS